jgi:hypothetical protein
MRVCIYACMCVCMHEERLGQDAGEDLCIQIDAYMDKHRSEQVMIKTHHLSVGGIHIYVGTRR